VELHAPVEALRKLRDGGDGWPFSSSVKHRPYSQLESHAGLGRCR